jgi:hypothetical protein
LGKGTYFDSLVAALHEQDLAANTAGVFLPKALDANSISMPKGHGIALTP